MDIAEKCQTVIWQLPNESVVFDFLYQVHSFYRPIHTYLSICICAIGAICNFCNIVVLTRKTMRTPVNMILTAMACCDTVVLFSNLIYTTHYTFVAFANCHPKHWSYGWATFLISHAHLSLVGHSSSIWLSVMLALIRYLTLRSRGNYNNGIQIGPKHSYIAIASVILFVSIMNAPNFLTYKIIEMPLKDSCPVIDPAIMSAVAYVPGVSEMAIQADCLVFRMAFWISGTVFKLVPCILLTIFVLLLMKILNEVKQNRVRLLKSSRTGLHQNGAVSPSSFETKKNLHSNGLSRHGSYTKGNGTVRHSAGGAGGGRADRTTKMLLVIVGVFLVTELPQGVMAVLSGMFSEEFRRYVYNNLGDILDLMALCNSCTTFVIYCTMSAQFRNEFRRVFMPATVRCWLSPEQRRCSEGYIQSFAPNKSQVTYLRPSLNGETNDHSITLTVVGSTNSVRKFNSNGNTPLPSPQPSATMLTTYENGGHLSAAPNDYNSGGSMASTLTVDGTEGDERAKLLKDDAPPTIQIKNGSLH